jgi:hypothetical protein
MQTETENCRLAFILVPTLLRGNARPAALRRETRDAERPNARSHAGAWEREENFGLVAFQYVDPGVISTVHVANFNLPGMFASALDAYGVSSANANG